MAATTHDHKEVIMKNQITNFKAWAYASYLKRILGLAGLLLLVCLTPAAYAQSAHPTLITACQDITGPGSFVLVKDLVETQPNMPCLSIHDTHNVSLNCNSHTVTASTGYPAPAISVANVDTFAIAHCTMLLVPGGAEGPIFLASASSHGILTDNTFGNLSQSQYVSFDSVDNTSLLGNRIYGSFQQYYSNGNVLQGNTAICPKAQICSALFISVRGSTNTIDQNLIDGQGSRLTVPYGADDGIVLQDETGDILSRNTIRNTWDEGIETVGNIANTKITSNVISSVVDAGIGGWFFNSWKNVTVANNSVSNTQELFDFFRVCGLRPQNWDGRGAPADTAVYFEGNTFSGNRFIGTQPNLYTSYIPIFNNFDYSRFAQVCGIPGERAAQPSDFVLDSNAFLQNDFGHVQLAPYFAAPIIPGEVVDKGGNICSNPGNPYPLMCN
jgi:parallel beta-helix repeat protein